MADELPDCFIDSLNRAVKGFDENALVLGEVWEDASNKTAYGVRRRYLMGGQLDSVMNYPFRDAILGFLCGAHASLMMDRIETIVENYPPQVLDILMNHIGTHDTERALTVLGGEPVSCWVAVSDRPLSAGSFNALVGASLSTVNAGKRAASPREREDTT